MRFNNNIDERANEDFSTFMDRLKSLVWDHYFRISKGRGHNAKICTYIESLLEFHNAEYTCKEQLLDGFYDKVMPRRNCPCKQHISKWAASQRY